MEFTEKQTFNPIFGWVFLIFIAGSSFIIIPSGVLDSPIILISISIFILLFVIILFFSNIRTSINKKNISVQYFPFRLKPTLYDWKEINSVELAKTDPLISGGLIGNKIGSNLKIYRITGHVNLNLFLKNGNIIMIGTHKSDEIERTISTFCKDNEVPFFNSLKKK